MAPRQRRPSRFMPHMQTAYYAADAQLSHARRLDITANYIPPSETQLNIQAVRENIGTRLLRIADHLKQTELSKSIGGYTLIDENKQFVPAVQERLEHHLSLDKTRPSYNQFLESLAQDFYNWLKFSGERRKQLCATIEPDIGVFITIKPQI
ncbi:hypothetical protein HY485_00850 [Candidatus Woesearchaeota archaeon]|nr:hypothetical protein [Candidatus Woesearchaeota archaeon]